MVEVTGRFYMERSRWPLLALDRGGSCQEKCILLSWRVSPHQQWEHHMLLIIIFWTPYKRQASDVRGNSCAQTPSLEAASHVTVPALLSVQLGEDLDESSGQGTSMSANGTREKWLWTCPAMSPGRTPGDPASPLTERSPAFITAVTNGSWKGASFPEKDPKTKPLQPDTHEHNLKKKKKKGEPKTTC